MWGSIISAAGSLIGGVLNSKSDRDNNDANVDAQLQVNRDNLAWAREQQDRNEALQREFAQSGIRWKTEDAKAAGLHPLYAMGAAPTSFSPVAIGAGQSAPVRSSSHAAGDTFRNMGQDLSRAVALQQTPEEKLNAQLQRELLMANIAKTYAERDAILSNSSAHTNVAMSYPVTSAGRLSEVPLVVQATNGRVGDTVPGAKLEPQKYHPGRKDADHVLPASVPGYIEQRIGSGPKDRMLYPAMGDQPKDELNFIDYIPMIRANVEKYGMRWLWDYMGLSGYVDRAQEGYRNTQRNLNTAPRIRGFGIRGN